jgi:hypothetical protein
MESIFYLHQKHFALLFLKEAIWANVMGLCLDVVVNQEDKLLFSTLIWMHVGIVYIGTCIHGLTSLNGVGFCTFKLLHKMAIHHWIM